MQKVYLETRIKPIMETMIFQVLCEKPDDPVAYMLKWLLKSSDYNPSGLNEKEQKELEELRIEVEKYRKEPILVNELEKDLNKTFSEVGEDDNQTTKAEESKPKILKKNRKAISAEAYGDFNKQKEFTPKVNQKTDVQFSKIKSIILMSFLFNSLDNRDLATVINATEEVEFDYGETIFNQGEKSDCLYIVEKGELTSTKIGEKKEKITKTYTSGDVFGGLAVLYNYPRDETVKGKSAGTMFKLDRETFMNIVSKGAQERRDKYEKFLRKVKLFSTLSDYDIMSLAEALRKCDFRQGEFVIRKGEIGNCLYIVEEGEAVAFDKDESKPFCQYNKGDFFGELSVLKDQPRKANIKAVTDIKLLSLDAASFKRILGPISDELKRREAMYKLSK